eukprot:46354-Amphidinium_carterae.1
MAEKGRWWHEDLVQQQRFRLNVVSAGGLGCTFHWWLSGRCSVPISWCGSTTRATTSRPMS